MTLYVSDLDGTLLGKNEKLSGFTIWALNSLIERGMKFTYATARSEHSAVRVTAGLTKKLPVIVYNGAFILDGPGGKPLSSVSFTAEERQWVRQQAEGLGLWPVVYAFIDGVEKLSWIVGRETPGQSYYLQNREWDKRLRPVEDEDGLFCGEAFYYTFIGEREALEPLYELAKGLPWITVTFQQELYREEYWLEMMPKAATKAQAAGRLKEILGCERMVAFGDAVNDLPLFAAADVACAVGNAVPAVKEAATEVIGGNEEDGVALWLLRHVKLPKGEKRAFSVRRFAEEDLEDVCRLFMGTVHTVCRMEYSREQVEAWAPPMDELRRAQWGRSLAEHFTLVAVHDEGRVVGFGDLDGGYLERLYVHQDFQGQGVAKALASALEAKAAESGEAAITTHASLCAVGFFEGQGYQVKQKQTVERPHPVTGQAVALENFVMEKRLG